MTGPLAPAVLDELERRLALVRRPATPAQLAERVLQLAIELRGYALPPRDLFILAAVTALAGAAACRDHAAGGSRVGGGFQPAAAAARKATTLPSARSPGGDSSASR